MTTCLTHLSEECLQVLLTVVVLDVGHIHCSPAVAMRTLRGREGERREGEGEGRWREGREGEGEGEGREGKRKEGKEGGKEGKYGEFKQTFN